MGELSLHRYEIRRVLGQGGTGTVYEAFDTKTHALVALKAVEAPLAESIFRLKHEFRVLSDVQHQNLVRFGELGCEDGKWFFTMELVEGANFLAHVRPPTRLDRLGSSPRADNDSAATDLITRTVLRAWGSGDTPDRQGVVVVPPSGPRFDEVKLRVALAQLVEALSVVHESGRVHRDVKPSNVLVTHEGRVVLLDFGLVAALAVQGVATTDSSGTPAFMAPEQIDHRPVAPAADWYALGTMLYLALTGRLPFSGLVGMVLEEKLTRPPTPPAQLVAHLPADLAVLCTDLLERDPERRPGEDDIRARLGLPARPPARGLARASEDAPRFVGRVAETRALAQALHEVRQRSPRALVIEGEAGMGKTALVEHFLAGIEPAPLLLRGRCYEPESVPFKGIDSIVDALSVHLLACPAAELELLLAGGVRYLATVFPVLGRVPAIRDILSTGRNVVSEVGLREEAFTELTHLLATLSGQRTLVVFLDDVQWADGDSMALLERAVLPASRTPCLFVATLRTGIEPSAAMHRLRSDAGRIELRGLSDVEALALLDELRPQGTPPEQREQVVRESGGHPLFLAELARAADSSGPPGSPTGAALLDVLRARIEQHDELDQRFLDMVAVAGAPTPYEIVARAAELEVGDCQTRLGSLRAAQLLQVTLVDGQRCVEPYHDRIREALIERLRAAPGGLAPLELRLGRALLAATPAEELPGKVFAIVRHLNAAHALLDSGEERLRVAQLDLMASREARLATAYDRAREHARAGLHIIAELGWQGAYGHSKDLHHALMHAEALAGQREAARQVFEACRQRMTCAEDSAALWAAWISLETGRGHFHQAIAAGREALRELGLPLPARITRATVVRQYLANRWAHRHIEVPDLVQLPELRDPRIRASLDILVALGPSAFFVDSQLLAWLNLRVGGESMRHGVCEVSPFGFAGYGKVLAGLFGEYARAAELGEVALALNRRFPSEVMAGKVRLQIGAFIDSWVRPFADARARLREAHQISRKVGDREYEVYAATIYSVVTFCESPHLSTVQEAGEWGRNVGRRRDVRDMAAVPEVHLRYASALRSPGTGRLDLGMPGWSDADFRAGLDRQSMPVSLFYYLFCSAELAFLSGEIERAAELIEQAGKHVEGIFAIPTTAELAFLEALVAARRAGAAGPLERARLTVYIARRLRRLDACARSCAHNFEAHALIVRAELLRVRGRAEPATATYARAVDAARRHRSLKREAIALELASLHARGAGDAARADELRREAAAAYRRWGGLRKAALLD